MRKLMLGVLISCLCFTNIAFARTTDQVENATEITETTEKITETKSEDIEVNNQTETIEETTKKKTSKKSAKESEEKSENKSGVESKRISLNVSDEDSLSRLAVILGKNKSYKVDYVSHYKLEDGSYLVTLKSTDKFRNGDWIVDVYNCASENYKVMSGYDSYFTLYNKIGQAIGVAQARKSR